jgi:hypothetical protein
MNFHKKVKTDHTASWEKFQCTYVSAFYQKSAVEVTDQTQ